MSPATTLAAYATGLALVFGAGLAFGEVVGPVGTAGTSSTDRTDSDPDHTEMDMTR